MNTFRILIKRQALHLLYHRVNFNHNFRWNDVKNLNSESSYIRYKKNKRLIFEMIHIKRQSRGLNKQNDTESLWESCSQIIYCTIPFSFIIIFLFSLYIPFPIFLLPIPAFCSCFPLFSNITSLSFSESHFKFILSNNID